MEALALVTYSLLLSYLMATFIGSLVGLSVFVVLSLIFVFYFYRRKTHIVHNPRRPDISTDVALDISNPLQAHRLTGGKESFRGVDPALGNLKTKLLKEK